MNICVVQLSSASISETFIHAHINSLPATVTAVQGLVPSVGSRPILSQSSSARKWRGLKRRLPLSRAADERSTAYQCILRQTNADVVLAEYGPTGAEILQACERQEVPLVVHFHGYDASQRDILDRYSDQYIQVFQRAAAIIVVSRAMRTQIVTLGASPEKVFLNPYGVDCEKFTATDPAQAGPVFLGVGRFVEKKAPYLTILAFAQVVRKHPDARLRMIGSGPLLSICQDIAAALEIDSAVVFLGPQRHEVVRQEMQHARAFVQHSVTARDGDSEGTPVAVLEAGASGLPVISTIHAGIPDVVLHEETGLLVDERDVAGMADQMMRIVEDPSYAALLGMAARKRVSDYFRMDQHIDHLWSIIKSCTKGEDPPRAEYIVAGSNGPSMSRIAFG